MKRYILLFLVTVFGVAANAQLATEPKIYQNYPKGMQLVQAGYVLQSTNSTIDNAVMLPDNSVDVKAHIGFIRYANFFSVGGKTAGFQVMLPYVGIDASILGQQRNNQGIGDMLFVFGTNITGGNSISFLQLLQQSKNTTVAWSLGITAPTGKYSSGTSLNPGGNRWQFRPELALTVPVDKWDFEAYVNAKFFTRNNAFPAVLPGQTPGELTQQPFYGLTMHAVYNLHKAVWLSADAAGRLGGQTAKNGVKQDNSQSQIGIGGTLNFTPGIHHQIAVNYLSNAIGNDYAPQGSIFSLKYMYVFGAGIDKTIKALKAKSLQTP